MTKYVLNSGGLKNQPERTKKFLEEIVEGLGDNPKILVCLFAQQREFWEQKLEDYHTGFFRMMPEDVKADFVLAMPDKFEQQLKDADVLYIHGGDDQLLKYRMQQFDLTNILKDKVVAGSSAGSNIFCNSYWTCDWRTCMDGLGSLNIKFLSHFNSNFGKDDPRGTIDWQKAKTELEEYKDKLLPVYALQEGEFIVMEKE